MFFIFLYVTAATFDQRKTFFLIRKKLERNSISIMKNIFKCVAIFNLFICKHPLTRLSILIYIFRRSESLTCIDLDHIQLFTRAG
jgi:hypothetical protein